MNDQNHTPTPSDRSAHRSAATPATHRTLSRRGALAAGGAASLLPFATMGAASAAPAGKGGKGKGERQG